MEQEIRLRFDPGDAVLGFSPSFTRCLVEKLEELIRDDRVFSEGKDEALDRANMKRPVGSSVTSIAFCILRLLDEQIKFYYPITPLRQSYPQEIQRIVATAKEIVEMSVFTD